MILYIALLMGIIASISLAAMKLINAYNFIHNISYVKDSYRTLIRGHARFELMMGIFWAMTGMFFVITMRVI